MTDNERFDRDVRVVIAHGIYSGRYVPYVDDDGVTQYTLAPALRALMDKERALAAEIRRRAAADDESVQMF